MLWRDEMNGSLSLAIPAFVLRASWLHRIQPLWRNTTPIGGAVLQARWKLMMLWLKHATKNSFGAFRGQYLFAQCCTHAGCLWFLQPLRFPFGAIFGVCCLGAEASVVSASLQSTCRSSTISPLCEITGEAVLLCYQTTVTLFSSESQCISLLPLFVFPFSFPQGGVAFTASNYRLYQSYISPYISVDLSRHLKGQLIALWQACAWPLKEKSRSWRCKPTKHTHSFPSFVFLYRFQFFPLSLSGIPSTAVSSHLSFQGT